MAHSLLRLDTAKTNNGCFPPTDMQNPPPLRSGHLNIKDEQCAKKKIMGVKFHITSYP